MLSDAPERRRGFELPAGNPTRASSFFAVLPTCAGIRTAFRIPFVYRGILLSPRAPRDLRPFVHECLASAPLLPPVVRRAVGLGAPDQGMRRQLVVRRNRKRLWTNAPQFQK